MPKRRNFILFKICHHIFIYCLKVWKNHVHLKDKIEFLENAFAKTKVTFPFINVNIHFSVKSTVNQCLQRNFNLSIFYSNDSQRHR